MINFEDFKKLDLRVGEIKKAEEVEDSNKLLRLEVDIGEEKRQLVAGIKKSYSPDELKGKKIVVLANLEPKELFGVESQGMLLAAHDKDDDPVLLTPESDVDPGSKIS